MSSSEISHETVFEIFTRLMRVSKKFNEIEKFTINLGPDERLYPSEIHVIAAVGNGQANQVTVLSQKFGITKGAVSQVVNKLSNKGYLKKISHGKEIILSLTPKGQMAFDVQDKLHNQIETDFVQYLDNLSPEEIESFLEIMAKIEEFIDSFLSKKEII